MSLSNRFLELLELADLPNPKECIGKVFSFTWNENGEAYEVVGRIDGLGYSDDEHFTIISNSLPKRRYSATSLPVICFYHKDAFRKVVNEWKIFFRDLRPLEQSGPSNPQLCRGEFTLL
jgi:hypothetical protein